jgi:uncharacterized repeat protein (TIGR01451 family)
MKTKITTLCLLIAISFYTKAQTYVTIPDSNFVKYLKISMPTAMNGNQMDTSSTLVKTLTSINVSDSSISNLTGIEYFINLRQLNCNNNKLTSLPALPNSLTFLYCYNNQLTSLPTLPNLLQTLQCDGNQLTNLPTLPNSLQILYCGGNQLTSLPSLPNTLIYMLCNDNQLTSLPALPNSLQELECIDNQLTSLPALPNSLQELYCHYNQLTSLPILPDSLQKLYCHYNQLTSLPTLPVSLWELICYNNKISCFPVFPNSLNQLIIHGNPFICLPNHVSAMDSATLAYPLCVDGDLANNPNGCSGTKGIVGIIYNDKNSNCLMDADDQVLTNVHLKLYDTINNLLAQTYSFSNGIYYFPNSAGTYNVKLDTAGMPYTVRCASPGIDSMVTLANPLASDVNFNIACKPGFDIGVQAVSFRGHVFPGVQHRLGIVAGDMSKWYNLNCAAGISGQIQVTVNGPVTFKSIAAGARTPSVSGNIFTYNISNFGIVNMQQDFGLIFTTDTTAQMGDIICVSVVVTSSAGDYNSSNNNYQFCYNVRNSHDPNMKEVYPIDVPPGYQDWLTYTVHFQNTGTAPAMNIRLADTLDSKLDLETFQVINYSHYNTISLHDKILTVHFPNIQLPDSTSNLEGSQGFVQYRIKPKANLPLGTQIKNTANIYFDYNPAIVTNTTTNEFKATTSINENKANTTLSVFPNPSNGKYFIKIFNGINISECIIEVYNLLGEMILNTKMQNDLAQIDLSQQPNGIYMVRIIGTKQSLNQRLIKN